jgi:hypothetical protein
MSQVDESGTTIEPEVPGKWASWVGFFLHLAIGVFPYSASGLLAPLYGIAIVYVGWFVALFFVLKLWNRKPYLVLLIPVIDIAWWLAVMFLGGAILGWTA